MKANVIVADLNHCGGGERLSLLTMHALSEMGIDFDLTTLVSPNMPKLENRYGKNIVSVINKMKKLNIINIFEELQLQLQQRKDDYHYYDYDITINTLGDCAPYFHPTFSKYNAITYCHYPSAKYHIEAENIDYLKELFIEIKSDNCIRAINNDNQIDSSNYFKHGDDEHGLSYRIKEYFRILKYGYWNMMRNSTIVTNSEFSRKAILNAFGIDFNSKIHIQSPPIDIETFSSYSVLMHEKEEKEKDDEYAHEWKDDIILTVSRIAPYKEIENAIKLARILKNRNIGKEMIIVGNLYNYFEYYSKLKQMVVDLGLTDYVKFEINASLDKLLAIMRKSKVYFHPRIGEHFGIAIVEAMAAGLIPVVSTIGGPAEFVPLRYQFNTLEHAAEIVSQAFHVPHVERVRISNSVNKFSNSQYIEGFQRLVNQFLLLPSFRRECRQTTGL